MHVRVGEDGCQLGSGFGTEYSSICRLADI